MSIRIRRALILVGGGAATMALMAAPASARTVTLHFFSKQVTMKATGPTGQPLNPNAPPVLGDRFDTTAQDYVGNHKHHAARYTATNHLACTVTGASTGTCSAQEAIGGSLLVVDSFTINFQASGSPPPIPISEGTGRFRGAHGTVTVKNIGKSNNSDVTIKLTNVR